MDWAIQQPLTLSLIKWADLAIKILPRSFTRSTIGWAVILRINRYLFKKDSTLKPDHFYPRWAGLGEGFTHEFGNGKSHYAGIL